MAWDITHDERSYLRTLAKKQAEYAALPIMQKRRQMWIDLNDGTPGSRPPVIIETGTFNRDFLPDSLFRCSTETGRRIEYQLLQHIRNRELIDDDKVIPDSFDFGWFVEIDELGVPLERRTIEDSQGVKVGFELHFAIKDLERDLDKLKPAVCSVDRDKTAAYEQFLSDLLGDILSVRLRTGVFGQTMLTHRVVELMGMEAFFMAMYDTPDLVHRLMKFLSDNALRVMKWAESESLLRSNNGNQSSFGSSYNFCTRLPPQAPGNKTPAKLRDMWGSINSQETVGISAPMYHEFCFPYYRAAAEPVGQIYYGCCEPPHPFWVDVKGYPHLRKVSVNRWTDEKFMGEVLANTGIVFSRKPDPNLLGVDVALREDVWSDHIRQTLDATKDGTLVEFIVRDVYTVHGNLNKARRAVELARAEINRRWPAIRA